MIETQTATGAAPREVSVIGGDRLPRLWTDLKRATLPWPVALVRTGIEATVLLAGWWLGGTVGWGTLAFAVLIGPMCARTLRWFAAPSAARPDRPGAACA